MCHKPVYVHMSVCMYMYRAESCSMAMVPAEGKIHGSARELECPLVEYANCIWQVPLEHDNVQTLQRPYQVIPSSLRKELIEFESHVDHDVGHMRQHAKPGTSHSCNDCS